MTNRGEAIADSLASIINKYSPLNTEEIDFEPIPGNSFPQFSLHEIQAYLENIKTRKSTLLGDIPAIVIKECAQYLCIPVRDLINKTQHTIRKMGKDIQTGNHHSHCQSIST